MNQEIKFKVSGSGEAIHSFNDFINMYMTDTFLLNLRDNIDASEVNDVDVDLNGDILSIFVIGPTDRENAEYVAGYIADEIIGSADYDAVQEGNLSVSQLEEECKEVITEDVEVPSNIYDLCEYMYKESENDIDWIPEYDDIISNYDLDTEKADYDKAYEIVKDLIDKVKLYKSDGYVYIELSDNHTAYEITSNIDDEDYWNEVNLALEALGEDLGTDIYSLGRMGRHICIDNNFNNAIHYDKFCEMQREAEQNLINRINNSQYEDVDESKEIKTEAEDLTTTKDNIEQASENTDNTAQEIDQVKGSLEVLITDEESAIDGYDAFVDETKKVVDKELADTIAYEIEEIKDDEKEHIEKLNTIKSSLEENKVEESKNITESKSNLSAEDLFSEYQSISYDIYGLEWNSASSERRQELAKQAVAEFIQKFPQAKVKAKEISDIMEDNNYHTDKKAFDELLKI